MRKLLLLAAATIVAAPAYAQTQTPSQSQSMGATSGQQSMGSTRAEVGDAVEFVRKAAVSDMFEIQASQLAQQKAQNQQVQQFAQEMVQDHQKTSRELQQLVREMHSAPPTGAQTSMTGPGATGSGGQQGRMASPGASGMTGGNTQTGAPAGTAGSAGMGGGTSMAQAMQIPTQLDQEHQQKLQQLQQAQGPEFDRLYMQQQVQAHQQAVELFRSYAQSGDIPLLRQWAQTTLPNLQDHLQKAQRLQQASQRG